MNDEQDVRPVGMLRWLAESIVGSRSLLAGAAGKTFGGNRDIYAALGYARNITPQQYTDRYRRNSIAGRIVEALPEATWRGGGEVIENEDPDDITEFELAWEEFAHRTKVWNTLLRADIVSGLGRYAVILLGAPGNVDSPLPVNLNPEDIAFLSVFGEAQCKIDDGDLVKDISDPRFGLPEYYKLTVNNIVVRNAQNWRRVHWTRIIHVCDSALDSPMFGTPRLERCWNLLDDLEKITGGGAEAFWLRANQGLHIDVNPEVAHNVEERAALQEQVDKYAHGITRQIRTRGVDLEVLGSDTASIAPNVDSILTLLAGGTKIPKRILTGSEMGELASTQDRSNWAERVSDRRRNFADPMVVRQLIDRLIDHGALPTPEDANDLDGNYIVRWPSIQNLDEKERAAVALQIADINGKMGMMVVTPQQIRDKWLLMPPLTKKDLRNAAKLQAVLTEATPQKALPAGDDELPPDSDEEDLVDEDQVGSVKDIPEPEQE